MKLLLRSLLLASLCAISSWSESSTGTVVVTQTPDVSVMEGDTVNISCCWTEKSDRTRINWWKQTEIKTKRYSFKNETQESQKNESSSCSTLIFSNITTKDSARYICRVNVEIPVLTFGEGNGTVITVTAPENKGDSTDHPKADGESSTGTVVVTQTPDVSVMEGDTVSISCCWTGKSGRMRINWWKQTEIKTKCYSFKNETQESQKNESSSCSTLIFSNITTKDSGRYICRVIVEMPVLTVGEGNGTVITVKAREKRGGNTDDNASPGTFVVTQTPGVSVTGGETVNICCWTGVF